MNVEKRDFHGKKRGPGWGALWIVVIILTGSAITGGLWLHREIRENRIAASQEKHVTRALFETRLKSLEKQFKHDQSKTEGFVTQTDMEHRMEQLKEQVHQNHQNLNALTTMTLKSSPTIENTENTETENRETDAHDALFETRLKSLEKQFEQFKQHQAETSGLVTQLENSFSQLTVEEKQEKKEKKEKQENRKTEMKHWITEHLSPFITIRRRDPTTSESDLHSAP